MLENTKKAKVLYIKLEVDPDGEEVFMFYFEGEPVGALWGKNKENKVKTELENIKSFCDFNELDVDIRLDQSLFSDFKFLGISLNESF